MRLARQMVPLIEKFVVWAKLGRTGLPKWDKIPILSRIPDKIEILSHVRRWCIWISECGEFSPLLDLLDLPHPKIQKR
jgi:hypothetical protein